MKLGKFCWSPSKHGFLNLRLRHFSDNYFLLVQEHINYLIEQNLIADNAGINELVNKTILSPSLLIVKNMALEVNLFLTKKNISHQKGYPLHFSNWEKVLQTVNTVKKKI
jgi:hypothetical protein